MRYDDDLTSNTSTPSHRTNSVATTPVTVLATGTFGGGTLTVEYSDDGGTTWVADSSVNMTAADVKVLDVSPMLAFRGTLTGATGPNINVSFLVG